MKPKNKAEDSGEVLHELADSESARPNASKHPSPEEIRQRAYELHLACGCVHGRDLDDWLQAERELMEEE